MLHHATDITSRGHITSSSTWPINAGWLLFYGCYMKSKSLAVSVIYLKRRAMNVQFCSNLWSASAGSSLAFLWRNQFTDLFNVLVSHIFCVTRTKQSKHSEWTQWDEAKSGSVTDRRADGRAIAYTRYSMYAVAYKNSQLVFQDLGTYAPLLQKLQTYIFSM